MRPSFVFFKDASKEFNSTLLLKVSHAELVSLVLNACTIIQLLFNKTSTMYVKPSTSSTRDFDRLNNFLTGCTPTFGKLPHSTSTQKRYVGVWDNVEFLEAFAALVDSFSGDEWLVCLEKVDLALVYSSLVVAHNWKVECIYETHAANNEKFGSALGWQTHHVAKCVEAWPEKFGFAPMVAQMLPKDVYELRDKALQESEPETGLNFEFHNIRIR